MTLLTPTAASLDRLEDAACAAFPGAFSTTDAVLRLVRAERVFTSRCSTQIEYLRIRRAGATVRMDRGMRVAVWSMHHARCPFVEG